MTHICVSKLTIIGSDNGLSPDRRQTIIWTNAGLLLIVILGTNFSEILIEILTFSFAKMRLKESSAKWRPFSLGLNVLIFPLMTWERTFQHWQRFFKRGLTKRVINVEFWPAWTKETCCIGNKTKIFSLSIERQLKFWMTAWPKLGNKATEMGIIP